METAATGMSENLHIPAGIRFECTGCGNCCLHWPVPVTDEDVQRIEALTPVLVGSDPGPSFRRLPVGDAKLRGFTHTLEKRPDGRCAFLTQSNRCSLHEAHGEEAKPAMCRMFPYSFTPTPSGVYMYVSFASSGVLANSGRLLTEQSEEMEKQLALFKRIFPHVDSDWSHAQVLDGIPLDWNKYLEIEQDILKTISNKDLPVLDALMQCSKVVLNCLPADVNTERLPPVEASAKTVDQLLLTQLATLYWPDDVFSENSFDINAREFMQQLVQPPAVVTIFGGTRFKSFIDMHLGPLPEDCEDLIRRFIYARIFGKLYFARSYAHLSLIAGIQHLFMLVALIRLQAKMVKLQKGAVEFWDVAEIIRTLERRMTQMNFSKESCTVLEIILPAASRPERIKQLAM